MFNCVTEYVTCDILQLYFVSDFILEFDHIYDRYDLFRIPLALRGHFKQECGVSGRYKHQAALVSL